MIERTLEQLPDILLFARRDPLTKHTFRLCRTDLSRYKNNCQNPVNNHFVFLSHWNFHLAVDFARLTTSRGAYFRCSVVSKAASFDTDCKN